MGPIALTPQLRILQETQEELNAESISVEDAAKIVTRIWYRAFFDSPKQIPR